MPRSVGGMGGFGAEGLMGCQEGEPQLVVSQTVSVLAATSKISVSCRLGPPSL